MTGVGRQKYLDNALSDSYLILSELENKTDIIVYLCNKGTLKCQSNLFLWTKGKETIYFTGMHKSCVNPTNLYTEDLESAVHLSSSLKILTLLSFHFTKIAKALHYYLFCYTWAFQDVIIKRASSLPLGQAFISKIFGIHC